MLILVLFYYDLFSRDWIIDFSMHSTDQGKFMSVSSFEENKFLGNIWSNKENSYQQKNKKDNDGYNNLTVAKQSNFRANKIETALLKPPTSLQAIRAVGSTIQNVFTLSHKERRLHIDQQLRDAIRIHHDGNFIQPKDETCTKRIPICILVGVTKCCTRELVDFLNLHPHIETYPSTLKDYEMPYFNSKYKQGDKWLQNQMPCTYSNQITLMKNAGYFHNSVVPKRIKQFNESIKLILMVREPVSRSLSRYMFERYKYMDSPNSENMNYAKNNFSSFVLNSSSDISENNILVKRSVYDKPMKLWLEYFNLSQFLIMDNEELKHDPVSALRKVERFLGLEHVITDKMFVLNKDKGFYCIQSNIIDTGMACYSEILTHLAYRANAKQV